MRSSHGRVATVPASRQNIGVDNDTTGNPTADDAGSGDWLTGHHHDDSYEQSLRSSGTSLTSSDERTTDEHESQGNGRAGSFSPIRRTASRYSFDEGDDARSSSINAEAAAEAEERGYAKDDEEKPVSWRSLPHKSQLAILTLARLSEPLAQTSLQAYMFYQLKSFDPSLPDATVSKQTGVLQGTFTAAQFATAVIWGRLADTERFGRKRVLIIGLLGTSFSCIGFGFSKSFLVAAVFRTLGGALNSNVGVMRTMIAEIIENKRYQSRAFLLLPMCFNVGVIIGPVLGGVLADPIKSYPGVFGPGSLIGGQDGVYWMRQWPYALPNILSGLFIFTAATAVFLGLDETHETARYRLDWGRQIGHNIMRCLRSANPAYKYRPLDGTSDVDADDPNSVDLETNNTYPFSPTASRAHHTRKRPSFRQTWTSNVILTLTTHFLLAFHTSAFNALCFVFLPNPRADPETRTGFLHFGGGLGMPSSRVGLATAIIGIIGLPLQIFIYPRVQFRMGTLKSYRTFLPFSPVSYLLAPFLVLVPDHVYLVWPALAAVISLQVISRTFSLPATIILVNNCVSDASVLGTVHGVAQSVSSAARTLGPLVAGWGLGLGLENNIVGAVWWALAVEASIGWALTWSIFEGKGIEKKSAASNETPRRSRESDDRVRRRRS